MAAGGGDGVARRHTRRRLEEVFGMGGRAGALQYLRHIAFVAVVAVVLAVLPECVHADTALPIDLDVVMTGEVRAGEQLLVQLPAGACPVELHDVLAEAQELPPPASERASVMLLLSVGSEPEAKPDGNKNWVFGNSTIADNIGKCFQLASTYMNIVTQLRTNGSVFASVMNIQVHQWSPVLLQYTLAVHCAVNPQCPLACDGHGTCSNGTCACDRGYGNVGCDTVVPMLGDGAVVSQFLAVRGWDYYAVDVEAEGSLSVGLTRSSGDPILFVMPEGQGFVKSNGLPTTFDYDNFADSDSFRERQNYHNRILQDMAPGRVYIAVYNNDEYTSEECSYTIDIKIAFGLGAAVCPADCNTPNGRCVYATTGSYCECANDFSGALCQGEIHYIGPMANENGEVPEGEWVFYQLEVTDVKTKRVFVSFTGNQGQAVLVVKQNTYPTLLQYDYQYTRSDGNPGSSSTSFSLDVSQYGVYVFGIFNMDYYVHQPTTYTLEVSENGRSDKSRLVNPFISIVLGLSSAVVLCLCMAICKRAAVRRAFHRRARRFTTSLPTQISWSDGARGERKGLVDSVVATFPILSYKEGMLDTDDCQCSVCLCDYEGGDDLRRIPLCGHTFHKSCIDLWFTTNSTCPLCRIALGNEDARSPLAPPSAQPMPPSLTPLMTQLQLPQLRTRPLSTALSASSSESPLTASPHLLRDATGVSTSVRVESPSMRARGSTPRSHNLNNHSGATLQIVSQR
eukprot:jgi/Chlat1/1949/Chrsp157S02259